jgi:hypothetical protein
MSMLGMGRNGGQPYHPPNLKVNRYYHSRIGNRTHVEAPPRQKTTVMNFSYFFPNQSNQLLIICGVVLEIYPIIPKSELRHFGDDRAVISLVSSIPITSPWFCVFL